MLTKFSRATFAAAALLAGLGLAGCSSGATGNPLVTTATLRFMNGSPDAGNVDFIIDGQAVFSSNSNVGYRSFTIYNNVNSGNHTIVVNRAGTQTALTLRVPGGTTSASSFGVTTPTDSRTTVVLAGTQSAGTLTYATFTEHIFRTANGSAAAQFHNASQQASGPVNMGYFQKSTPSNSTLVGGPNFNATPVFAEPVASYASSGIGFYADIGATRLTLFPSQIDPADTQDVLPFNTGNFVDQNASIYLIDGPAGAPSLVGKFDPTN